MPASAKLKTGLKKIKCLLAKTGSQSGKWVLIRGK